MNLTKIGTDGFPSVPKTSTTHNESEILGAVNLKSFKFSELATATLNFRTDSLLGEGCFGYVYKGWVDEHSLAAAIPGTGLVIAVKRLNNDGSQGHREWLVSTKFSLYNLMFLKLRVHLECVLTHFGITVSCLKRKQNFLCC